MLSIARTTDDESKPPLRLVPTETSERNLRFTEVKNNSLNFIQASLKSISEFLLFKSIFQYGF